MFSINPPMRKACFWKIFQRRTSNGKNQKIRELFKVLFEIRSLVSKKIEEQRTEKKIRSSLEVSLSLKLPEKGKRVEGH